MTESTTPATPGSTAKPSELQDIENIGIEAVTAALTAGPELLGDAENVFNDIAHGEGGVAKVQNAMSAIALLLQHAEAALASVTGTQQQSA